VSFRPDDRYDWGLVADEDSELGSSLQWASDTVWGVVAGPAIVAEDTALATQESVRETNAALAKVGEGLKWAGAAVAATAVGGAGVWLVKRALGW